MLSVYSDMSGGIDHSEVAAQRRTPRRAIAPPTSLLMMKKKEPLPLTPTCPIFSRSMTFFFLRTMRRKTRGKEITQDHKMRMKMQHEVCVVPALSSHCSGSISSSISSSTFVFTRFKRVVNESSWCWCCWRVCSVVSSRTVS